MGLNHKMFISKHYFFVTPVVSLNDKQGASPGMGAAEAGQSNYHQVQDNLYTITDHNTRSNPTQL